MKCMECNEPMMEVEYGEVSSDVTEIGLHCFDCDKYISPSDCADYIVSLLNPEVV